MPITLAVAYLWQLWRAGVKTFPRPLLDSHEETRSPPAFCWNGFCKWVAPKHGGLKTGRVVLLAKPKKEQKHQHTHTKTKNAKLTDTVCILESAYLEAQST